MQMIHRPQQQHRNQTQQHLQSTPQNQNNHLQQTPKQRRNKSAPPLGLKNLGNTCYLNSVLQCLTYTPQLSLSSLNSTHSSRCNRKRLNCPYCVLEKRISRSLSVDGVVDTPNKINSCLRLYGDHFRQGRQEDAHEFLRFVVDACVNVGGGGGVKKVFGGEVKSGVKCGVCGGESNKVDEIMDVSLDLVVGSSCIEDGLRRFFQTEVLDGNNKYHCETCKKLVTAEKQLSISRAPNVLVIHLKRFEGVNGGKIDRVIGFGDVLELSSYMSKESQDPHPEYSLYGTIVHSGYSPDSGHYYSYIKNATGKWYCCNDAVVKSSNLQDVMSEKVYILFFNRTNQRPQVTKKSPASKAEKSSHCNGNDNGVTEYLTAPPSLIAVPKKLNGVNSPDMENNGNVYFKFGKLKPVYSEGVHANGNGNIRKGENVENIILKELVATENIVEAVTFDNVVKVDVFEFVDNENKQAMLSPVIIGEIPSNDSKLKETKVSGGDDIGHALALTKEPESCTDAWHSESGNDVTGFKRKLLEANSEDSLTSNKFLKRLTEEASSSLRLSSWPGEVYDFMHASKVSIDVTSNNSNSLDIGKILIAQAKTKYLSKVPESLKQHLVNSLRSFLEKNLLLDT